MKTNQRGIMMQKSGKAIMTKLHTDTSSERVFSACNYVLDGESMEVKLLTLKGQVKLQQSTLLFIFFFFTFIFRRK